MILDEDESKNKDIPYFNGDLHLMHAKREEKASSLLATAVILNQFHHDICNSLLFFFICN
jgi:hypothetical protein